MNDVILLCWDSTQDGLKSLSRVLDNLVYNNNIQISRVLYLYCEYLYNSEHRDSNGKGLTTKEKVEFLNMITPDTQDYEKESIIKKYRQNLLSDDEKKDYEATLRKDLKKSNYRNAITYCHSFIKYEPIMIPESIIHKSNGDSFIEIEHALETVLLPRLATLNPQCINISLDSGTHAMTSTLITLHSKSVFNAYIGNNVKLWAFSDEPLQRQNNIKNYQILKEQKIKQNPYITSIELANYETNKTNHTLNAIDLDITGIIKKTAAIQAPILLLGERGTGKSYMIDEIYNTKIEAGILTKQSPKQIVLCGSLSGELVDDKLFGHWKGAFTGADNDAEGAFELCNNGLLFLDEIQDIPKSTQRKILRALNEGIITRQGHPKKGQSEEISVKFSLVCASNNSLSQLQSENKLDPDFFDRIAPFICEMKPLREYDINMLSKIWTNRWLSLRKEYWLPKDPDDFNLVKDVLIDSKMYGNIRDINQLIAYIARDVYERIPKISENKKKERYVKVLNQWKLDYNKKYRSVVLNDTELSKKLLEEYGWSGMEKLFKHWLADYVKTIYNSDIEAAEKMKTTDKTLRNSRNNY